MPQAITMSARCFHPLIARRRKHFEAATHLIDGLVQQAPFGVPPQKALGHLIAPDTSGSLASTNAIACFAGLVRAHALDFHEDAGGGGQHWARAAIDAWGMWLMLRESNNKQAPWPWDEQWGRFTTKVSGEIRSDTMEGPTTLYPSDFATRENQPITMYQWERAIECYDNRSIAERATLRATQWPDLDMPAILLCVGSEVAISVIGKVVGARKLEIQGIRKIEQMVGAHWIKP